MTRAERAAIIAEIQESVAVLYVRATRLRNAGFTAEAIGAALCAVQLTHEAVRVGCSEVTD